MENVKTPQTEYPRAQRPGRGNDPKQFVTGNDPKQFVAGNDPTQFVAGNDPKQFTLVRVRASQCCSSLFGGNSRHGVSR